MAKKKVFQSSDLSTPEITPDINSSEPSIHDLKINHTVVFPANPTGRVGFSFKKWYGKKIDAITYIFHVQILRFVAKQDAQLETATVASICGAVGTFLTYLALHARTLNKMLVPADINSEMINGFLHHTSQLGLAISAQRGRFSLIKTALLALGQRGIFKLVTHGPDKTFPLNPFPNSNRSMKKAEGLTNSEKKSLLSALRSAIQPIWDNTQPLTSEVLSYCLLIVALHTGRNTHPLLEMPPDCLKPHPKDDTFFLVLWKRRGHNTYKVALREESETEKNLDSMPGVRSNVARVIRQVISRTQPLREQATYNRVWLYRSRESGKHDKICYLSSSMLQSATAKLVADYNLRDNQGNPLKITVSRLRKTFANRIYEILDGDIASTARALGNSPRITSDNYLAPTTESKQNWRFMGEILVKELLSNTIGNTYHKTPVANCNNSTRSRFMNRSDPICTSFLNCVRCEHFAVTSDDLYKLFSFYFRIFKERNNMPKHRWNRELAHIPRLIDKYIVAEGVSRGIFKQSAVDEAKAQAQKNPHPFWSSDCIPGIEVIS